MNGRAGNGRRTWRRRRNADAVPRKPAPRSPRSLRRSGCWPAPAAAEEAFDLDALVAAAKAEPPITIYDSHRQDRGDGRELLEEVRRPGDRREGLGLEPARDDHPRGAGEERPGRRRADHRCPGRARPAPAAGLRRELAAAGHEGQDPGAVPGPARDHHQRQRLGLQHRGLRRVPGQEHLGADAAEVEGQGRLLRPAVQADLSRLVQPDRDAPRRRDGRGLRDPVRQGARPRRGKRDARLGQGFRRERPALDRQRRRDLRGGRRARARRSRSSGSSARPSSATTPTRATSSASAPTSGPGRAGPT